MFFEIASSRMLCSGVSGLFPKVLDEKEEQVDRRFSWFRLAENSEHAGEEQSFISTVLGESTLS